MITKKQFTDIFNTIYPAYIKKFKLQKYKIKHYIITQIQNEKINKENKNCHGYVFFEDRWNVGFVMIYNKHRTYRDCVDTIVHEMLHIALHRYRKSLYPCLPVPIKAHKEEERLVRILTKVIIEEL